MDNFLPINWQVENFRMTAFPSPSAQFNPRTTWWENVMGVPPDTSTYRARQQKLQEEGPIDDDRKLRLTTLPDRIDWLLLGNRDVAEGVLPIVGSFEESRNVFLPIMQRWFQLETCPSLSRLAFGAVLLCPVADKLSGYQQLNHLLPSVDLNDEDISDFSYQINRPRETTTQIAGLQINRLSKWSVLGLKQIIVIVGSAPISTREDQATFVSRLELDINTHQDFRDELLPDQLPEILLELMNLGQQISVEGDIR